MDLPGLHNRLGTDSTDTGDPQKLGLIGGIGIDERKILGEEDFGVSVKKHTVLIKCRCQLPAAVAGKPEGRIQLIPAVCPPNRGIFMRLKGWV